MAPRPRLQATLLFSDRHMVSLIIKLVCNQSFTLTTGTKKQSRFQRLKNVIPQKSVLATLLFNTYDLPVILGKKFVFAVDLATLHYASDWQALERTLTQDMATLSSYLHKWKLKLSTTKTVSTVFHLSNKEAQRGLNIFVNRQALPFRAEPTYLDIKLDRKLTFRQHLKFLCKKLTSRVSF